MPNLHWSLWTCCLLIGSLLAIPSVSKANTAGDAAKMKFFESKVRPLLAAKCIRCHGEKKQKGDLRLDSLAAMIEGGESGAALVPGDPDESFLIDAINYESFEMPPTGKLDAEAIAVLTKWVKMGAPWPDAKTDIIRSKAETGFTDEERAYWAFQPIRKPQVPQGDQTRWSKNPIDAFIYEKLEQSKLSPAPEADRFMLIRRLYLDLIGLPPSAEEMDEWSRRLDTSPEGEDAYTQLVDHLLDSPHYGERWARHWLDVVRYADSDGYSADHYRPLAWRYRDYVVRSFNDDKPYDQFIREQLAGDELAPNNPDALTATTFLRLGVYEFNQRDARGHWTLIMNEVTDVVGEALLGFSVGCARCHDHKFDPILRKDYYRLQAFFTPMLWHDDVPTATAEQLAEFRTKQAAWETMTTDVRRRLHEIEQPYLEAEVKKNDVAAKKAVAMFPEEIQAIYHKPREQRSSLEEQLAYLVHRQVPLARTDLPEKTIKKEQREAWKELKKELAAFDRYKPKPLPTTMTIRDSARPISATFIPDDDTQKEIAPGFLSILDKELASIEKTSGSTGRRTALARWLTRPDHPLTARVMVNRLWQHHFGRGIVATPNELGRMGQPPTHPKLLDYLAVTLIEEGWKLKALHRLIATSATYRQSAFHSQAERFEAIDPENKLRWRADIRRMDAEQVRDAMLAASGELDRTIGGERKAKDNTPRALYVRRMRNSPDAVLGVFDGASGMLSMAVRDVTTTPGQTLMMLNGSYVRERSVALARRVVSNGAKSDIDRVNLAHRFVFGLAPHANRLDRYVTFLGQQVDRAKTSEENSKPASDPRFEALADFCHVLLNSNEFLYVE
jgi:mono/diheme cytochrome c family protein